MNFRSMMKSKRQIRRRCNCLFILPLEFSHNRLHFLAPLAGGNNADRVDNHARNDCRRQAQDIAHRQQGAGIGCRAAQQKWQGKQLLPWLLVLFAASVIATWAAGFISHVSLVEILIPFCVMAIANGAIYPIVVAQALRPFPHATGRAATLQNTLQLGLCFLASLVVSWLISISKSDRSHVVL